MDLAFVKMHRLGNDYIYLDGFEQDLSGLDLAGLAPCLADRHFAIGGDGLIAVLPPDPGVDAAGRMRMFNADGSEGQMCGNGLRCVAKLLIDAGHAEPQGSGQALRIQTGAGVLTVGVTRGDAGQVESVAVDMGVPVFEPSRVPVRPDAEGVLSVERVDSMTRLVVDGPEGEPLVLDCVSFGNPHAVLRVKQLALVDAARLASLGRFVETHPAFPERVNLHLIEPIDRGRVNVLHWERGSGATLACGTGASAVVVATILAGETERHVVTALPGGELQIDWDAETGHVTMTGPATRVFDGRIRLP